VLSGNNFAAAEPRVCTTRASSCFFFSSSDLGATAFGIAAAAGGIGRVSIGGDGCLAALSLGSSFFSSIDPGMAVPRVGAAFFCDRVFAGLI